MDVRLLTQDDIPQAKALWKEAFGDSDAFIEWYFANKLLSGNSLAAFDGQLVSVVHMLPHHICIQGKNISTAYIAGAATAKNRRGEGHMRTLLSESLKLMKGRGILVTHLYPFKHSFYENFGWTTYSYVHNRIVKKPLDIPESEVVGTAGTKELAPLYELMMEAFDGYVLRGEREWRWRLEEHAVDGGKAALLCKYGKPAAYMLYNTEGKKAKVIESVYLREEDLAPLLSYILKSGHDSAEYFVPAPANGEPYGMARIVDAYGLLEAFGLKHALESIRIVDGFAPWNDIGEGGKMTIQELARAMHRGVIPACGGKKASRGRDVLAEKFSFRSTCIFEQY